MFFLSGEAKKTKWIELIGLDAEMHFKQEPVLQVGTVRELLSFRFFFILLH